MKMFEISNHLEQVQKIRGLLGDYDSPAGDIKRPPGMYLYLFDRRIRKLKQQERLAAKKLEQGLLKYIASSKT